jgi:hypothetical protein
MSHLLAVGKPLILTNPAAAVLPSGVPQEVVAGWNGEAQPVEVALYAESQDAVYNYPTFSRPAYVGMNDLTANPPIPAYFVLEYGCGGIVRRRIVDLVTARVFLGVCDNVRVLAARWRGNTSWSVMAFDLQVTASIAKAVGGSYDELQSTGYRRGTAAAALSASFSCPSGSYAWQAGVFDAALTAPIWGTAQPDIYFSNGGEEVVYRIASYEIVPSVRRFKPPFNGSLFANSNGVVLGARDVGICVTWYLNS